ncbi:MAG: hypothetical protein IT389_16205 [Nitrospira sp.]|nr:hypothetical protein [Nitrospira sp.]
MRLDNGQIELVDPMMAEVLRRKSPAQRLSIGFALWDSAKRMLTAHLSSVHPEWSVPRINREVVRRLSHGAADAA